jgi:hypothetical protein
MARANEDPLVDGHPIRYLIASVLLDGSADQEPALLDDAGIEKITTELDRNIGSEELVDAVEMLLGVAYNIETAHHSPFTAQKLIDIVEREPILRALRELNRNKNQKRAEEVQKQADKLTQFTGSESQKKAPKNDDAAPKGSIKLGSLNFPKKL